jgi:hypothetical protein
MILHRTKFFVLLFIIGMAPFLLYKIWWIANSSKTNGVMGFVGKNYTGQIEHTYAVIIFKVGEKTFWFNGNENIFFRKGETVPVRYQDKNPYEARLNIFVSMWGDTLVYGGIPLLILLVVFLHPEIIPRSSKVLLARGKPFIKII